MLLNNRIPLRYLFRKTRADVFIPVHSSLPFGLVDELGFIQIPLVITVAMVFFLIEKTAIHLQDPFENLPTDTPVTSITRTIEINLKQMLNETQVPGKVKPQEDFYLL